MNWQRLNKKQALEIYTNWEKFFDSDFIPSPDFPNDYQEIRNILQRSWAKGTSAIEEKRARSEYQRDLSIGLDLYELVFEKYEISIRSASDDDIWRFISMKVIPDIVWNRWGDNPERFFRGASRLWIKTLFWYIHLSWQGNRSDTELLLQPFNTDDIVQLVERTGTDGYRISLNRAIMKCYHSKITFLKNDKNLFRKVMKLNTALLKVIEPELVNGGVEEYANNLFSRFVKS